MSSSKIEIVVTCGRCNNVFIIQHLNFTHIVCSSCKNVIDNPHSDYYDDEPTIHQYIEE